MLLNVFNGGISQVLSPFLLQSNEAIDLINCDISNAKLTPIKEDLIIKENVGKSQLINFNNEWLFFNLSDYVVEISKRLFKANNYIVPKFSWDGKTWKNCGIKESMNKLSYEVLSIDNIEIDVELILTTDETLKGFDLGKELKYTFDVYNSDGIHNYQEFVYVTPTSLPKDSNGNTQYIQQIQFNYTTDYSVDIYRLVGLTYYKVGNPDVNINTYDTSKPLEKVHYLNGTYQYAYTYYNKEDGIESRFSYLTDEINVKDGQAIKLSNFIPSNDSQVTNVRLYRIGGNLLQFTLVKELDNKPQEFIDNLSDNEISNNETLSDDNLGQAPQGLIYLTEYNSMLFGSVGSKLYFSGVGEYYQWSPYNWIELPHIITGLASTPNGLLVFTYNETYIITGNSPETLTKFLLTKSIGCINSRSINYAKGYAIWLSKEGICISSGSLPEVISKNKLKDFNFNVLNSAVFNEAYYLFTDKYTLIVDSKFGISFRKLDSKYYSGYVKDYKLNAIDYNGNMVQLYEGENYKQLYYKSPKFTESMLSMIKNYKVFYLYLAFGEGVFTIYIDDEKVLEKEVKTGFNEIKIPQDKRLGYYIQFEYKGNGELSELEYKAEGRTNGR